MFEVEIEILTLLCTYSTASQTC